MKKTALISMCLLAMAALPKANAANVIATVTDYTIAALSDGSFVIISQDLPPLSSEGEQCSKWHFVRNGQGGITSADAVDKMYANALAGKHTQNGLSVFLDATPIPNNGAITNCHVSRVDLK